LAQKPDLICFTGDYASHSYGFDAIGLREILREASESAPTYGVLGNHDGGAWLRSLGGDSSTTRMKDLLDAAGVRLLYNASAQAHGLNVVGIADIWSGEARAKRAFEDVDPMRPTIALCHNPDGKTLMKAHPWNLMLSGHTHGGQARIPGIAPSWLPVSDKRFIAGLYEWEDRNLFITRGLGSPKHVRAFCRPEVSILHLG
jgi:predicted MPP superfamily phosphohydrolase